VITKVK